MFRKLEKLISFVVMKIEKELKRLKNDWKEYSEEFDKMKNEYDWRIFYS